MPEAGCTHTGSDCRKWHVFIKSIRPRGQGTEMHKWGTAVSIMQVAETASNVSHLYFWRPPLPAHHDGSNPAFPTTQLLPSPSAAPCSSKVAGSTLRKAASSTETNHLQPNLNLRSPEWFLGKALDSFSCTCCSPPSPACPIGALLTL